MADGLRQDLPVSYKTTTLRTLLQALKAVFHHKTSENYDYPEEQFRNLNVVTEWPLSRQQWPAILVRFNEGQITNAGVAHSEEFADDNGIYRTWLHRHFNGSVEFELLALSPYDLAVLSDALVEIISFGKLNAVWELFYDKFYGDQSDPYTVISLLYQLSLNSDVISGSGMNVTPAPWEAEDSMVYTCTYDVELSGGFYNSIPPDLIGLGYVREVDIDSYIRAADGLDGTDESMPFVDDPDNGWTEGFTFDDEGEVDGKGVVSNTDATGGSGIEAESVTNPSNLTNSFAVVTDAFASATHAVEITAYDPEGWGVEVLTNVVPILTDGDYTFILSVKVSNPACPDLWEIDLMVNGFSRAFADGIGGTLYGAGYAPVTIGPVTLTAGDIISMRATYYGVSTDGVAGSTTTIQAENFRAVTGTTSIVTPAGFNGTGAVKDTQDPDSGSGFAFDRAEFGGLIQRTLENIPITTTGFYDVTLRLQWHGESGDTHSNSVNVWGIFWPRRGIMWGSSHSAVLSGNIGTDPDTWLTMSLTDVALLAGDTLEPSVFNAIFPHTVNRYAILDQVTIAKTGGFVLDAGTSSLLIDTIQVLSA